MNPFKKLRGFSRTLLASAAVLLALTVGFTPPAAQAQDQYGLRQTLIDMPLCAWGNATASNQNLVVSATKWQEFVVEVTAGSASTLSGTMDIRWSTSSDGTNWTTPLASSGSSGWFALPISGAAGGRINNRTNILLNSIGFWRADYVTNTSGQTLTNFNVKVYTKPRRYGGFGP